jgi:hypothetical protein
VRLLPFGMPLLGLVAQGTSAAPVVAVSACAGLLLGLLWTFVRPEARRMR